LEEREGDGEDAALVECVEEEERVKPCEPDGVFGVLGGGGREVVKVKGERPLDGEPER